MKNNDFYKLLMNKDKIQLKENTKWARDLQLDPIPLESYFGDIKSICKDDKLREFYFKFLHIERERERERELDCCAYLLP